MRKVLLALAPLLLTAASPKPPAPRPKPQPGSMGRALYAGVLEQGRKQEGYRLKGKMVGQVRVPITETPGSWCLVHIYTAHPAFNELRHERGVHVPEDLKDRDCQGTVKSVVVVRPEDHPGLTQEELDGIFLAMARSLLDW